MNGIRNEVMVVVETPFVDGRMIFFAPILTKGGMAADPFSRRIIVTEIVVIINELEWHFETLRITSNDSVMPK